MLYLNINFNKKNILIAICSLSFLYLTFTYSFFSIIYNLDYYDSKFKENGVYEIYDKETALYSGTKNILDFFQNKSYLSDDFNNKEKIHLEDVKKILNNIMFIGVITFVLLVISFSHFIIKKEKLIFIFSKIFILSLALFLTIIMIGIVLYIIFGFDELFTKFHEISFEDNYSFDPEKSFMKSLYPDNFFRETLEKITLKTFIIIVMANLIVLLYRFITDKTKLSFSSRKSS